MKLSGMKYNISYQKNITRWEEALPLGNGEMGCLIWGSPAGLRFSLDRVDIWDTTVPQGTESKEFTYGNLVRLAREKNTEKIREIFDAPYNHPVPTKLPVGKIILHIPGYQQSESILQLWDAQALLHLGNGKGPLIRSLVHAKKGIGMISVSLPETAFSIELKAPEFGRSEKEEKAYRAEERSISQGDLKSIVYEAPVHKRTDYGGGCYLEYFCQQTKGEYAYGVVMGVKTVRNRTDIFYRIVTTHDNGNPFEKAAAHIRELLKTGYDGLLPSHVLWWQKYWAKSRISLPDEFMEKNWYMANYLLASCSRKGHYPMPLQGVWTADQDMLPPWKGDYHNDLNTQMSYYHYLKANHLNQGICFVEFLWKRREAAREFARGFYGTKGLCLPSVMTIDGKPLGGWPMYSLSPVNQIWLCKAFDDYFFYTGDNSFLADRAYPYFKETAECISGLLVEGEDGYLCLPISSSPEIHDDEAQAFLTPNSNYDLSLLSYLYKTLETYAGILQLKGEETEWRSMRSRLGLLAVDERGVLMLAADEVLTESHRHFSHAHAIHPLRLLKYDSPKDKGIIDAVIEDLEKLGTSMWVGFSFCWMAELYAIAHKGEQAAKQLRIFWEYFCSPNGFHLNGDYKKKGYSTFTYRPFTLEANMCAADALQEMLLYGADGVLEVFPAVPREWLQLGVSFEQLRCQGGVLVSAWVKDERLVSLVLEAPRTMQIKIKGWNETGEHRPDHVCAVTLQCGKNYFV